MGFFSVVSAPAETGSSTKSSAFFPAPVRWQPATMTCTLDPSIGQEEVSWSEILRVSKPVVALVLVWGVGVASGALGLVWFLR